MDSAIKKILKIVTDMQEEMAAIKKVMATKDDIKNMATKDDIKDMATKNDIRHLEARLSENTEAIEDLKESMHSTKGFAKEIDMLIADVSAIKKHVGMAK